jgi:hypothetical protein
MGLIPDSSSRKPPAQEFSLPVLEFGLEDIPHISPRTDVSLNVGEDLSAFTSVHTVDSPLRSTKESSVPFAYLATSYPSIPFLIEGHGNQ